MSKLQFLKDWLMVASAFILAGSTFGIWASRIPVFVIRYYLSTKELEVLQFLL